MTGNNPQQKEPELYESVQKAKAALSKIKSLNYEAEALHDELKPRHESFLH